MIGSGMVADSVEACQENHGYEKVWVSDEIVGKIVNSWRSIWTI